MKKLLILLTQKFSFFHSLFGQRFKLFKRSYSQFGEDLQIIEGLKNPRDGFYVDIGAHHPFYYSNTYLLSKMGLKGINVDGSSWSIAEFKKHRPEQVNLHALISNEEKEVTFYEFDRPTLNTISESMKLKAIESGAKVTKTTQMMSLKLSTVLEKYAPKGKGFFFLNVDVEGFDLEVLKTNDWDKYKPKVICVEDHLFNLKKPSESEIYNFLSEKGYEIKSKLGPSLIFKLSDL